MFRKNSLILLITLVMSQFAFADLVNDTLRTCMNNGGDTYKDKKTKGDKICYDILCVKSTADLSGVDFSQSAREIKSQLTNSSRGAAVLAWDQNVCVNDNSWDLVITGGSNAGSAIGSGGGGFDLSAWLNANLNHACYKKCKNGLTKRCRKCLGKWGVNFGGDIDISGGGSGTVRCSADVKVEDCIGDAGGD